MKAKILTRINALIALLLSALGFGVTGCMVEYGVPEPMAEYGVPHATFVATGSVSDEESQPVENIRVQVKNQWGDPLPETYTAENGQFSIGEYSIFPVDSIDIIVTDTAGIYTPDSVRLKVDYDKSAVQPEDHWNEGTGSVHHDFQLKKK